MVKIQNFKYHERGLNRFFGPLEAKIMDILWEGSSMTIKDVQAKLDEDKTLNFNTVMTVMNRLVDKDILTKRTSGRATLFQPVVSKDHFLEGQSKEITHELIEEFGALIVNHMLDALEEVDEDLLAKLERKIKTFKKDN